MGRTLQRLGYTLESDTADAGMSLQMTATRQIYRTYFAGKLWFKSSSLLRTLRPALTSAEIDATCLGEDHPPEVRTFVSRSS